MSDDEKYVERWKRLGNVRISRLLDFVEPTVHWCGTDGCLHRGSEHDLNNRCLICSCSTFSARTFGEDMATILRFVDS